MLIQYLRKWLIFAQIRLNRIRKDYYRQGDFWIAADCEINDSFTQIGVMNMSVLGAEFWLM
ncbi:hypothetical protein ABVF47_002070 [Snodgrassella alvi]|uniref:Uncharacterized protein n=1 Tax=Snodgrassella alvi TaxID=1196083 RepID=A0A2N9X723_9NEIS|nr:hypothetical protein [Snodgrassella alvi]PIT39437.1 hypothetical protein BHC54_05745 [Snodgrassella alvi]